MAYRRAQEAKRLAKEKARAARGKGRITSKSGSAAHQRRQSNINFKINLDDLKKLGDEEKAKGNDDVVEEATYNANPPHLDGVPDMSSLIYLEGPNVLHNLSCRYEKKEIYTSISKVLLAVNPYERLDCYDGSIISNYRAAAKKKRQTLPPHVFSVSQRALHLMLTMGVNQSMIVCGESGSGKTESAKHLMRYLAFSKEGSDQKESGKVSLEQQVLDANPILESFGNAKTVLNNNSSRFGKFTKIVFGDEAQIMGSVIETYLLEQSRVVRQDKEERNYHIFYQLFSDAVTAQEKKEWGLTDMSEFRYTNQSGCTTVDGMDDSRWLNELRAAFTTIGFSDDRVASVLRMVAGILWFGNVQLEENDKGDAKVTDDTKSALENAARLWRVDATELEAKLLTRTLKIGRDVMIKPLSVDNATNQRDAISKALYNGLFSWIVRQINVALYSLDAQDDELKWIGILDVFGFESFVHNSFEQFCINFANERLQQYFNNAVIASEQVEYTEEGLIWTPVVIKDNQDVIDLVQKKPTGILPQLDSACKGPKPSDTAFVQNLFNAHRNHPRIKVVTRMRIPGKKGITPINGFEIKHYAGPVIYNAKEFLVKNNDSTSPENKSVFDNSQDEVARSVLPEPNTESKSRFRSVGNVFSKQLNSLMNTLYETMPHFVRCIKPNSEKKPQLFDWDYVKPQLECGGIIEALRILKLGYPTRTSYEEVFQRYGSILQPTPPNLNKRDFCEAILRNAGDKLDRSEFQLGLSKVFFRPGKGEFLENLLASGETLPPDVVQKIQMFLLNKRFQRARGSIRVHIVFALKLRSRRAVKRVKRVFGIVLCMAQSFWRVLKRIRQEKAIKTLQAYIRSRAAWRARTLETRAAYQITRWARHCLQRKQLMKELDKRIEKKRALFTAKELEEKRAAERERRQRLKEEREKKAAEERERIARKKAEEERRQREETERLERLAKEEEERLARIAKEEEERKLRIEQERFELQEKAKQFDLRETEWLDKETKWIAEKVRLETLRDEMMSEVENQKAELAERATRMAADQAMFAASAKSMLEGSSAVDIMAQRLENGREIIKTNDSNDDNSEETQVLLWCNKEDTTLCWGPTKKNGDDNDATDDGENGQKQTPSGSISLADIVSVAPDLLVEKKDAFYFAVLYKQRKAGDGKTDAENTEEQQEGNQEEDDDLPESSLHFSVSSAGAREELMTDLRYIVRNVKELSTLSRPKGDKARGNELAAQLYDQVQALERRVESLESGEGLIDPALVAATKAAGQDQDTLGELVSTPKHRRGGRGSSRGSLALSMSIPPQAQLRIQALEEENERLTEQLHILEEQKQALWDQAESYVRQRELEAAVGEDEAREKQLVEQVEAQVAEISASVEKAEEEVHNAEVAIRNKQDLIREKMKLLAEKQTAYKNTKDTMNVLGLTEDVNLDDLEDETSLKLVRVALQQRKEQEEAEASLHAEYSSMVSLAEELNSNNEKLAISTHKQKQAVEMRKITMRRIVKQKRGAAGGGGRPAGKDDGCVIA